MSGEDALIITLDSPEEKKGMKICSFVPFTSPMAMFTRTAMSTVPWYEIGISVAILMGSAAGVGVLSAKIYRVGVCSMAQRRSWERS